MTKQEANKKWPKRGGFYYFNDNGTEKKYPSITTILGVINKPFLYSWYGKGVARTLLREYFYDAPKFMEMVVSDIDRIVSEMYSLFFEEKVTKAGNRGKYIHNIATKILQGIDYEKLEQNAPYTVGLLGFVADHKPKEIYSEKIVKSDKYGIAGQLDWVVEINGETWLLDIKTSPQTYVEMEWQLGFYAEALAEEGLKVDRVAILHLPGNGKYSIVNAVGDMEAVMAAKTLWVKKNEKE